MYFISYLGFLSAVGGGCGTELPLRAASPSPFVFSLLLAILLLVLAVLLVVEVDSGPSDDAGVIVLTIPANISL